MTNKPHDLSVIPVAVEYRMLNTLHGMAFCQTGTMSITRQEMEAVIVALGGSVHSAIKSNTDYLIVPNGPFRKGSKYTAAQAQGKMILSESDFCDMIVPTIDELMGDGSAGSKA